MKIHNQNKILSKNQKESCLFVCIRYGSELLIKEFDECVFEEVLAKLVKILGQLEGLLGVLSCEDRCWKEQGVMIFAQLWCCGMT
jgi:hypothetical protein